MLYKEVKQLTNEQKLEYLGKYISRYEESVINKFTNNKKLVNQIINDNTIMHMIIYVIEKEEQNIKSITKALKAPFDNNYFFYSYKDEYNHILYELIIKD